nr:unnamed protein product [Callosobruchus chinensis]
MQCPRPALPQAPPTRRCFLCFLLLSAALITIAPEVRGVTPPPEDEYGAALAVEGTSPAHLGAGLRRGTSLLAYNELDAELEAGNDVVAGFNGSLEGGVYGKETDLSVGNLRMEPLYKKKILNVGYLTAVKGELKERQGLQISGAISMALKEVNEDPDILPNVTLALKWYDTRGETVAATKAMTDMICEGVSAFFWTGRHLSCRSYRLSG